MIADMKFQDTAVVPASVLYRAALVSPTRGDRIVSELRNMGRVRPVDTPTGRKIFTPPDAEIVFNELVSGQ